MNEIKKANYCCMKLCMNSRSKNKGLTFFGFPRDSERCQLWIKACEREDLENLDVKSIQKNYHICSLHFTNDMFLNDAKNRLKPTAVPAIYNNTIMPDIECVVLINTSTSDPNTLDDNIDNKDPIEKAFSESNENKDDEYRIKEEFGDELRKSSRFEDATIKEETTTIDEPRRSSRKFSILRNILKEKEDATQNKLQIINPTDSEDFYDLNNICRICLSGGEMKQIEKDYCMDIRIQEMLKPCINFNLPEEKILPKKICAQCLNDLRNVHDFIKKCENSKIFLENYIKKQEERKIIETIKEEEDDDDYFSSDDVPNYDETSNESLEYKETSAKTKLKSSNRCRKCKVKFKYYNTLLSHNCDSKKIKNNITLRIYKCAKCNEKFKKLYDLSTHRKLVHRKNDEKPIKEKNPTRCARCDIIFTTIEELAAHRKESHSQTRIIVCPVCSKKMSAKAYRSHKEIHCTKLKYCCEYCGRSFSSSSNFNRHMYIHFDMKPHVCDICGRGFRVKAKLTEHRLIHSNERRYMCETCGKSFRQKNVLRAHIQLKRCGKKAGRSGRGNIMKHECSECTEKFYTLKELKQHRSHTHGTDSKKSEGRIYKCEKCEDSFTSTAFLKRHALIHAETKFICPTCNRAFYTMERLKRHETTHDAVKNFICEVCSKAFASKLSLKCHMTVHTGEKKYHCQLCPKSFSQSGQLTSHTRTHTGSRPYQCPYCERAFALNGNLTVHIRTHTGERPYKCKFCEQAFYDSSSAKKHMTVKHGFGAME